MRQIIKRQSWGAISATKCWRSAQKGNTCRRRLAYHVHRSRRSGFAGSQRCVPNRVRRLWPAKRRRHQPRPCRNDSRLRPGGHVAVLEFSTPTWQPFKGVYGWYFRHVLPRVGRLFARNSAGAYEYLPASVVEFPQGEALLERLRSAGLTDARRYPLTFGVATLYVGRKPSLSAGGRR